MEIEKSDVPFPFPPPDLKEPRADPFFIVFGQTAIAGQPVQEESRTIAEDGPLSANRLHGFNGVGEGGTIGAPAAIANAVADALAPLGIEITELRITAERLFRLLRASPHVT